MASAALWGMSLALFEKATLKDGGIEQTNFNSYTPLRMSQVPEVAVSVIANGEHATGVGEPAMTVVALAIGNTVFNARRPRALAAEHGRSGESGDEGARLDWKLGAVPCRSGPRSRVQNQPTTPVLQARAKRGRDN